MPAVQLVLRHEVMQMHISSDAPLPTPTITQSFAVAQAKDTLSQSVMSLCSLPSKPMLTLNMPSAVTPPFSLVWSLSSPVPHELSTVLAARWTRRACRTHCALAVLSHTLLGLLITILQDSQRYQRGMPPACSGALQHAFVGFSMFKAVG